MVYEFEKYFSSLHPTFFFRKNVQKEWNGKNAETLAKLRAEPFTRRFHAVRSAFPDADVPKEMCLATKKAVFLSISVLASLMTKNTCLENHTCW